MSLKKNLISAGIVAAVVAAGIGLHHWGYADGRFDGEDYGRFAQREYDGDKMLADSCFELADAYDAEPHAKKAAKGVPDSFDRAPCYKMVALTNKFAPKGTTYDIPEPGASRKK